MKDDTGKTLKQLVWILPLSAAKVVADRLSGYSKGFGFVQYATIQEAEAGIKGMDGQVNSRFYGFLNCLKFNISSLKEAG